MTLMNHDFFCDNILKLTEPCAESGRVSGRLDGVLARQGLQRLRVGDPQRFLRQVRMVLNWPTIFGLKILLYDMTTGEHS